MVRAKTLNPRDSELEKCEATAAEILKTVPAISSKEDVLQALNIPPSTLKEWTYAKTIPSTKMNGKRVYIKAHLIDWLARKLCEESIGARN